MDPGIAAGRADRDRRRQRSTTIFFRSPPPSRPSAKKKMARTRREEKENYAAGSAISFAVFYGRAAAVEEIERLLPSTGAWSNVGGRRAL